MTHDYTQSEYAYEGVCVCSSSWQALSSFSAKHHLIVGDHARNKGQLWHIGVGSGGIEKIILHPESLEQSITHLHAMNGNRMFSVCVCVSACAWICVSKTDRLSRQAACKDISLCVWNGIQYSYFSISLSLRSPQSPPSNDIFLSHLHTITQRDPCQYHHMYHLFTHHWTRGSCTETKLGRDEMNIYFK